MCKKLILLVSFVLVLGLAASMAKADITTDLAGYWPFEEGSGTTAADATGNGNDGTFNGDVEWVAGYKDGAVRFDTGGERVVIGPLDPTAGTNAMTLAAWINWEGQGHSIEQQGIIGKRLGWDPGTTVKWYWQTNPDGDLLFRADNAGGGTGLGWGNGLIDAYPNEWIHVAVTWDNGAAVQYVNAEEVGTGDITFIDTADDTPVTIGCVDSTNDETFIGSIDEARIYSRALTAEDIVELFEWKGGPPVKAGRSSPANGATDVPRDVVLSWKPGEFAAPTNGHKVYFSDIFNDVNDGIGGIAQDANSYTPPQRLDFDTTYYWRVDEVNALPDSTVFKGSIWSFTVEPFAYPIANIIATASSSAEGTYPADTIDGSGLDADDLHSIATTDMWQSAIGGPEPIWIQYEFDRAYKLTEMWVWNYNVQFENILGFGFKDVTIEYSVDGVEWTALGDYEFVQSPGQAGLAHNTTIDLGGLVTQYIRLTANTHWTTIPSAGLSEVRIYHMPVHAREPQPALQEFDVALDALLGWRPGREADSHEVYFSNNELAVIDGTALAAAVSESLYQPAPLGFGQTYYWKINEVNEAASTRASEGDVWNFSTIEYFVVDDFEDYNDWPPDRIYETWIDGYGIPTNGAMVGYPAPDWDQDEHYVETTIVHGGDQAMPLFYDHNGLAAYSEAERTWDTPQDWAVNGADTLTLWFRGHPAPAGSFVEEPLGTYTMTASGADIYDTTDGFHFAYKRLSGAGTIQAKILSIENTHQSAKTGVMIRDTLDADSAHAMVVIHAGGEVAFQRRVTAGTDTLQDNQAGINAPVWVKLERSTGGTFTAWYSTDGTTWLPLGAPELIPMALDVYIGLPLTSNDVTLTCQAEFSDVQITGAVTQQWTNQDIGILTNTPEPMYVALADSTGATAAAYHDDPTAAQIGTWTEWPINLQAFADQGVNVAAVSKLSIGVGDPDNPQLDAFGILYIDDIRVGHPISAVVSLDPDHVVVPKTSVAPIIDGQWDAVWSDVNETRCLITNMINTNSETPEDSNDLSATFKAFYDDNNFYIFVEVQDSVIDYEFSDWQGDGVEIYFDGDYSHGDTYDGVNDTQITITVDDVALADIGTSIPIDGTVFKVFLTDSGYNLEASFPLEALQIYPSEDRAPILDADGVEIPNSGIAPNNIIGFEVQINDNDSAGGRQTMLRWHSDDNDSWDNPSLFGQARLVSSTVGN